MASGGRKRAWVADLEKNLADANPLSESALWKKHSIYRVPAAVKDLNPCAYRPQVVSLGPFHHGDADLRPMEEHKRRALAHLSRRAHRPLEEFVAAVEESAAELEDAYQDLGNEWRGEGNRERFLQVMVTDGCFLLEIMRMAAAGDRPDASDYAPNDPVFSRHGTLYTVPYVCRDMLIVENQLPLLVLEKLVAVESGKQTGDHIADLVKKMVLRFLSPSSKVPPAPCQGLHPLDVFRKSLLNGPYQKARGAPADDDDDDSGIIRSAAELYEAGIRFRKSRTDSLHDISFRRGVLSLPAIVVDDSTESMFLNLMAFERLHAGAGNDVTAYVFFMDSIVESSKDVALLTSKGIMQSAVGSDKAVAKLFNGLSKDVVLDPASELDAVHRMVNRYCRNPCHVWRAKLIQTYFRSPWAFLSLAVAAFLVMTAMQTVYTVLQFYHNKNDGGSTSPPSAPAPR